MPIAAHEHHDARKRFELTLARGRLASTYLFTGPEGIGKRTFARELTAALLCLETGASDLASCGRCESCRLLAAGNHPDVQEISRPKGKSTLPIELFVGDKEHRNKEGLCHEISLKPYLGTRRVAIIDDADYLSTESANCLLKTLEEPPPRSVLILIGASLSKQLPTIRSRCQVIRFKPLSPQTVAQILREGQLLEEHEDADALALRSGGSVSAALDARDQTAQQFYSTLITQLSNPDFDPVRLSVQANEFCAEGGVEPSVKRRRIAGMIGAVIQFLRQALAPSVADSTTEPPFSPASAIRQLEVCLTAETALLRNANLATLLQYWLVGLANAR